MNQFEVKQNGLLNRFYSFYLLKVDFYDEFGKQQTIEVYL